MNRTLTVCSLLLVAGCSSSSSNNPVGDDASDGASQTDDGSNNADVTTQETGADAPTDSTQSGDASDGGTHDAEGGGPDGAVTDGEAGTDGPTACAAPWTNAPTVVTALALPDGGTVLLHAAGSGSQDYACTGTFIDGGVDGGDAGETFAWVLTGPDAELKDCNGTVIGHHFPSEAGASAPEWMTLADGTYVIGKKVTGAAYTPDGGSGSVPWLLLQATSHGGTGTLSNVTYIHRLNTDGGVAPSSCDPADASTLAVPYTADYYFYGP